MAVVAAAAVEKEGCFVEKAEAEAETEMGFAVVERMNKRENNRKNPILN